MFIFAHSSEKYHQKVCVLALFVNFHVLFSLHFGMFSLQNAPFRLSSLLDSLSFFNPGNVVLAAKYHHFSTFLHFKHVLFLSFIRSYAHTWSVVRGIQICVLVHFTSRFAAFSLAFCCRQPCVLLQIALCFGAFSVVFCMKQPKKVV